MTTSKLRLISIKIENFKIFDKVEFVFTNKNFSCLIGPNGSGKSTLLEIMQMLFFKFDDYNPERLAIMLNNCARRDINNNVSKYFKIDATFSVERGKQEEIYNFVLTQDGIQKDHPEDVKDNINKLCYYSTFDKELHKFQLKRKNWKKFKTLMEAVTGFEVVEQRNILSNFMAFDGLEEYIVDFFIKKPNEIVRHKDFSDGEKKIVKSFASILNMKKTPSIILIDNIEMHVELKRHLPLISQLIKTFPKSQIISTSHSYRISRTFKEKTQIYDMRLINASNVIREEPKRLILLDEIDDLISKINSVSLPKKNIVK